MKCRICDSQAIIGGLCPECWNRGPAREDFPESRAPNFRQNGKRKWQKPRTAQLEDIDPTPVDPTPVEAKESLDLYKPESIDTLMFWAPLNPRQVRRFSHLQVEESDG